MKRRSLIAPWALLLGAALSVTSVAIAWAQSMPPMQSTSPAPGPLEQMPRDLEVRFALSALPPHLRSGAAVYVLDPSKGYIPDHKGTNGFSCIVERTEWAKADFRNDIYTAVCYDAEGSKHHLQVWMDVAKLRAQGMSAERVKAEVARRFRSKMYRPPARSGISYMVAPLMRTYPTPDPADKNVMTMSMPHFMFYAPNLSDRDLGSAPPPSPYPFIFERGPHGYAVLLVGETERAKIVADAADLLTQLCDYRAFLCLKK